MGNDFNLESLRSSLTEAKNILILIAGNPKLDQVAAALALYLSCKKKGKGVGVGCATPMTVALNRLVGVDKITDKVGNRNLIISFDYDLIEKVTSNVENNRLNLVIEPKLGTAALTPDMASFSHTGLAADIVFIIGATKPEDLGNLATGIDKLIAGRVVVNIAINANNTNFGKINLVNPNISSYSELMVNLIKDLGLPADSDIVTNLFSGIQANTENFQSDKVTADTFEAAAWCLKNGARKGQVIVVAEKTQPATPPPSFAPHPFQPENKESQPPPDWFKPKIYHGKADTT